jgi:hypothetical protein
MNEFFAKLINRLGIDPDQTNFVNPFLLAIGIVDLSQNITDDEAIRLIVRKAAQNLADAAEIRGNLTAYDRNFFLAKIRKTNFATMAAVLDDSTKQPASNSEARRRAI